MKDVEVVEVGLDWSDCVELTELDGEDTQFSFEDDDDDDDGLALFFVLAGAYCCRYSINSIAALRVSTLLSFLGPGVLPAVGAGLV